MNTRPIKPASLNWNEQGTPVSREFGDVYFSNESGLEETRHVFLQGNDIPQRFYHHPRSFFTLAETGFGTGLNFLTLWQTWRQFNQHSAGNSTVRNLHFISFEKHPLQLADIIAAHQSWPELAEYAALLQQQWPLPVAGCHRLQFDQGRVTLDLWFGDVNQLLPELDHSFRHNIDAWFLDGFAPSKNPDMWTDALFKQMVSLTRSHGTFATYTAAGFVRRGLQQAGFEVFRRKGFGPKREMLTGTLAEITPLPHPQPWHARPAASSGKDIAIVGGGIASAFSALALLERGANVTLYCADQQPAQGASGNRQGVLYPLLNGSDDLLTHFFSLAFPFARRYYDRLSRQGIEFAHQWCGVSQLGYDRKSRNKIKLLLDRNLPTELVSSASAERLTTLCGLAIPHPGVNFPQGGWLCPAQLTQSTISYCQTLGMKIHYQHQLQSIRYAAGQWSLDFANGIGHQHQVLIMATGHHLTDLPQMENLPLSPVRGQISHIPTTPKLSQLRQVLCYDGYMIPVDPLSQQLCIGASYLREQTNTEYDQREQQENRQRLIECLTDGKPLESWSAEVDSWPGQVDISGQIARCSIRSATRDHLPLVGAVPDYQATLSAYPNLNWQIKTRAQIPHAPVWPDLFVIGGLGARGLCSAPLLAEILAAQIYAQPLPLSAKLLDGLAPNRMWIRKLLKGGTLQ